MDLVSEDYEIHVQEVLKQIPDADPTKVAEAFARYEKDFLIPPADAMRSVLRRFQGETGTVQNSQGSIGDKSKSQMQPIKKVEKLSDLSADDKNIEIEVQIITHNPRTTMVRGEEKVVPYGLLEDQPWSNGNDKTRWEYKDWGNSPNLNPGSIVRIEGASVNEYQGRMSLNINQSTRIVVIEEGERPVNNPGEPIEISQIPSNGNITVVGRLLASRNDVIHKRDGSGSIDVVRGRIADDTGAIGFLSWESFEHELGSLLKIENATVNTFRDTPEIQINKGTRIEIYHDANFSSTDELSAQAVSKIEDLKDGSRDVEIIIEIQKMIKRTFTNKEGEEKSVWSGDVADPTGRCRCSIWSEPPFDYEKLPVVLRLKSARVRAWQGIPDITIDDAAQIEVLAAAPWGEDVDLADNLVDVELYKLATGSSRVGIRTSGHVVSVRDDCGIILRCPECRRVLRDGECATHGLQDGEEDVRLRLILDDGIETMSLFVDNKASCEVLGMSQEQISSYIDENGQMAFVQDVREKLLGRKVTTSGRTMVDEQSGMILSTHLSIDDLDPAMESNELRLKWEVA